VAQRIILADTQTIFRTGAARVLSMEEDFKIVAQCSDLQKLMEAVVGHKKSVVIFASSIAPEMTELLDCIEQTGSKSILILEHGATLDESVASRPEGVVLRSVAGPQLVDCVKRVAVGEKVEHRASLKAMPAPDKVGARVLERLTPKEVQIIALVADGCKNKEIAERLGTKEQVVKNYLRGIYDKIGVSDRLELALFTIHHRTLAAAADQARTDLVKRSA